MDEKTAAASASQKNRFGVGLLIYTFILIAISGVLLLVLHRYLTAYEQSQPKVQMEAYQNALESTLPDAAVQALADLDPAIQSPEENQRWALSVLQGVSLVKDPSGSSEETLLCQIKTADGIPVGTVTFAVTGKGSFGVPVWEVTEESFDFSPYYQTLDLTVPPDYTVYLGELRLGPDQIADPAVQYDALSESYLHYSDLPLLVRYAGGPYVGSPALRVCDENGQELSPEELTQEHFLDHCSQADRDAVEAFIPDFLNAYVYYTADVNGSALNYYGEISSMTVPGSPFHVRLQQAVGSFGWSNTKAVRVLSSELRCVTDLGNGRFLVDVGYESEITGLHGPVNVPDQVRIILVYYEGSLRADALYHY